MSQTQEPIAVIGMSCRFPGNACNPEEFWKLLCRGDDAVIDIPKDRWDVRRFSGKGAGKMGIKHGGFLQEKWDSFDSEFFQFSPREADFIDPQQRLLLELTWEAFEDCGIVPEQIRNSDSGVFIGAFTTDWQSLQNSPHNLAHCESHTGVNSSMTILSARLAYFFDLKGPCLTVDTACSSSLVALHLACQSLRQNECRVAVSGGVNAMLIPQTSVAMSKGRFLNPDGRCKSFSEEAKGYIRGEGGGIVILKKLKEALADKDSIYAVIRGTGVNHDGYTQGIAQPNGEAQKALMQKVLQESGIKPHQINLVEAHGTGTPIGDPIEAAALNTVLQVPERVSHCFLGAVKSNIGHLEAAAGIAGFIKTVLCLKHQQVPPNLHCEETNRSIPFEKYCLKIPKTVESFEGKFAAVNAFGYGGTNAHALLENYAENHFQESIQQSYLFPFSAKSKESLQTNLIHFKNFLNEEHSLQDLSYTLFNHRTHFPIRAAITASSHEELRKKLDHLHSGKALENPKTVFIYSGMGPQWFGMGRELMKTSPVFLETIVQCDKVLQPLAGWSLLDEKTESQMNDPIVAQVSNFALQAALTHLLGITPDATLGHSIGEVAAAYAAGCLTLEEGVTIAYHRALIQSEMKGKGTLLATGLSETEARALNVSIAAINTPQSTTLAGTEEELQRIIPHLDEKNIFSRFLRVNIAYHSHHMDPLKEKILDKLKLKTLRKTKIPLYSTVTGDKIEALTEDYWWKNIRQTVLFDHAIKSMKRDGYTLFVEIGPHPVLGSTLHTLNRKKGETEAIQECIEQLYVHGYPLKYQPGKFIRIPTYAWDRKHHWIESEESKHYRLSAKNHVMLSRKVEAPNPTWQVEVNDQFFPWIEDHQVDGETIFPAAGYIEGALALFDEAPAILEEITFSAPLFVKEEPLLQISSTSNQFQIHSYKAGWTLHATGKCFSYALEPEKMVLKKEGKPIEVYPLFQKLGLHYGSYFQGIKRLWRGKNEAVSEIQVTLPNEKFYVYPPLLDAALQTLIGTLENQEEGLVLPYSIERFIFYKSPTSQVFCKATCTESSQDKIKGDLQVCDAEGNVFFAIKGLTCRRLAKKKNESSLFYQPVWEEKPLSKNETSEDFQLFTSESLIECIELVKKIDKPTTLCIVTKDYSTPIWGLARVIRQEMPHIRVKLIQSEDPQIAEKEVLEPDDEVSWENGIRRILRLKPFNESPPQCELKDYALELSKPGAIENLFYRPLETQTPRPDEVTIRVHTASLNFKDLMKVLGMLDKNVLERTYFGNSFGMECSGTITAVGSRVKNYRIGDKVCAFAPNTFRTSLTLKTSFLTKLPHDANLEIAPIYIPFVTVLRGLKEIAQLKKGETILIHSATGAVGLAAIQYAQYVGARIIATASNEEKRAYLKTLGVDCCANSRSLTFANQVLEWTNGRGVDVVLNSLAGDFLVKSWSLLAPYGRFIEIGKQDISLNNPLPMKIFNQNTTFAAVDLDRVFVEKPHLIKPLLKQANKIFKPLPCKVFPASETIEAFKFMAKSHHIGKIMIRFHEEIVLGHKDKIKIDPKGTYLITGGLSGFGLATAEWLAEKGAKHLILLGRTIKSKDRIKKLQKKGVDVKCGSVDITDKNQLTAFLQDTSPLKGVIHSAMVLEDAFIPNITEESLQRVLDPKIKGCQNIAELTHDLDFFVLYSSISSLIGNPGQGAYAAANAFLDHFPQKTLTVNWGALNTGVLLKNDNVATHLKNRGITPLSTSDALDCLWKALQWDIPQVGIFDVDWKKLLPQMEKSTLFTHFETATSGPLLTDFNAILALIKEQIGKTLKMDPEKLDPNTRINTLGIDSLMAMELQTSLQTATGIKIPTLELMKGPTASQLATKIESLL